MQVQDIGIFDSKIHIDYDDGSDTLQELKIPLEKAPKILDGALWWIEGWKEEEEVLMRVLREEEIYLAPVDQLELDNEDGDLILDWIAENAPMLLKNSFQVVKAQKRA